jgi:hypothetical protein
MGRLENLAAAVKGLKGYRQSLAQGRTDLAEQYRQQVLTGIEGLKGITGIQQTQQRMELERAEERHRVALRPKELRGVEAGTVQAELTAAEMQLDLDEKEKTIEALRKQLAGLGVPGETVESLERGELAAEAVARRDVEMPRVKAEAGAKEEELRKVAAEVQKRMREAELEKEIPERRVEAEEKAIETAEKKADYEQLTLDWLTKQDIPKHEAITKSMLHGKAMQRADAEIKLMQANARKAEADADRFGYEQDADAAIRQAYMDSGLDFNDFLINRSKIKAGLMPAANETLQNIEDGSRIYAQIKARGPGDVDPIDLMAMEAFAKTPRRREMIQELLPKPEDREAALEIMRRYINSQKTILRRIDPALDYDALVETAVIYSQEDVDAAREDLKIEFTETPEVEAEEITKSLDILALRLLNDPDVMRDEVLSGIQQNRAEGFMFDQIFGKENMDNFYRLMAGIQGVWLP